MEKAFGDERLNHLLPLPAKIGRPASSPRFQCLATKDIRIIGRVRDGWQAMLFTFTARGHPSIRAMHRTTLEITTERRLTRRGDCIVAVGAEYGLLDLPSPIKMALSSERGLGKLSVRVRDQTFTVEGKGSPQLAFTNPNEIVVRRSGFTSDRTLMVHATGAAVDIPRMMVKRLQDPEETIIVEISATS